MGQFLVSLGTGIGHSIAEGEGVVKGVIDELGGAVIEKIFESPEGSPPYYGPGEPIDGGVPMGPGPAEYPVPDGAGPIGPASTLYMPTPDGGGPIGPASTLYMPTPDGGGPIGPASMLGSPARVGLG